MNTIDTILRLKAKVREHGRYRLLAEATGLSESWLAKFATQASTDYQTRLVNRVAEYFAPKPRKSKAGSTSNSTTL